MTQERADENDNEEESADESESVKPCFIIPVLCSCSICFLHDEIKQLIGLSICETNRPFVKLMCRPYKAYRQFVYVNSDVSSTSEVIDIWHFQN